MQALVMRANLPNDIDEFLAQIDYNPGGRSDLQSLIDDDVVHWSMPKHSLVGDVVFFQVAAGATKRAKFLTREMRKVAADDSARPAAETALRLATRYAGSIISVGRVTGVGELGDPQAHFSGRFFVPVSDLHQMVEPVRLISEAPYLDWPEFTAYGPVQYRQFADQGRFDHLVASLIEGGNTVPDWLTALPLTSAESVKPTRDTWMDASSRAEFGYPREDSLRHMYADWLLKDLSDKRKLYVEVQAEQKGKKVGRVDNVILVNGVPIPVEVKLNAASEPALFEQLDRYRTADTLKSGKRALPARAHRIVLLIDQTGVYITDGESQTLPPCALLRDGINGDRISQLRNQLETLTSA